MVFVKRNSIKSDIFFNPIFIPGFSGSGSRVQGPGQGSGSRSQKQPFLIISFFISTHKFPFRGARVKVLITLLSKNKHMDLLEKLPHRCLQKSNPNTNNFFGTPVQVKANIFPKSEFSRYHRSVAIYYSLSLSSRPVSLPQVTEFLTRGCL